MKEKIKILGVDFSTMNMKETVDAIACEIANDNEKLFHIITGNPEIVLSSQKDNEVKSIINKCDLVTADGVGIVLASKWRRKPLEERVTGFDLLTELLKRGNSEGWSFYFLGAQDETSKLAIEKISKLYPNLKIVGRQHGYFSSSEEEKIILDINNKKPDILVVALGAPRAEKLIYKYKENLSAKIAVGVGGSLDGISGKVKRAPDIWIKLNIEWLYRLICQPSRWKRQLALPIFAYKAFTEMYY